MAKKVRGDRLVLGMLSVMRTLIMDLHKRGVIDANEFVTSLQQIAIAHREVGNPNELADAIHSISEHLHDSIPNAR